jgi:hypothetical protein
MILPHQGGGGIKENRLTLSVSQVIERSFYCQGDFGGPAAAPAQRKDIKIIDAIGERR